MNGSFDISNLVCLWFVNNSTGTRQRQSRNAMSNLKVNANSSSDHLNLYFSTAEVGLLASALLSMIIVSVSGNFIVCFIVWRKPAMRSAINLLLATMAFADIATAIFSMSVTLITVIARKWLFGDIFCGVSAFLHALFVSESIFVLFTISVDRYLIIVRRKDTLTPLKAKISIMFTWICALLVSLPPVIGWGKYQYSNGQIKCSLKYPPDNLNSLVYSILFYVITYVLPILVMGYTYFYILRTVRRNSTRVQNHPPPPGEAIETKIHRGGKINIDYSFKTRAFATILILYVVFVICCLPFTVTRFHIIVNGWTTISHKGDAVLVLLVYIKTVFNPVIYYVRISKFREACLEILPRWCRLPKLLPGRTLRRIRPHAIYEVDKKTPFLVTNGI